jgi:polyferredoxin
MTPATSALRIIKAIHTVIWAFFAVCVLAIPISAWYGEYAYAGMFIGIVFVEVLVLVFNRWRCPLTPIAARYTADRRDNFDIYLPEWLARHNKLIFGVLYTVGLLYAFASWCS